MLKNINFRTLRPLARAYYRDQGNRDSTRDRSDRRDFRDRTNFDRPRRDFNRDFNRADQRSRGSRGQNDRGQRGPWNPRGGRDSRGGRDIREASHEDKQLIGRNRYSKRHDDGLMGKQDYALDRELIKTLKWTDLVSGEAESEAHSAIKTTTLEEKRILSLALVNSLVHNRKYTSLTPVQAQTLVPILNDDSVVVRAKTGTGKTAAFSIPTIQRVLDAKKDKTLENKVKAVIISPTRELAQQISDEISKILDFGGLDVSVQCFVGGLSKGEQLRVGGFGARSKCCDIVVATPGRLEDILEDEAVLEKFDSLIYRVFDEADRLLDIGFESTLRRIKARIDEVSDKETPLLLFSATADRNVRRFASDQFGDRVKLIDTISKDEPTANELVDQKLVVTKDWAEIYEGVAREIVEGQRESEQFKAIVFLPTVAMVDNYANILYRMLPKNKDRNQRLVMAIHGQKTQAARQKLSDQFRRQDSAVLVTTDVIARGMDFPKVSHVFQVGPPTDVPSYVHRIGRTARIGNRGKSSLYLTNHVRGYIDSLARENIRPQIENYAQDSEFHDKFVEVVPETVGDADEPSSIINTLFSYMAVLKAKYPIVPQAFVRDMMPFATLYGEPELPLSKTNAAVWRGKGGGKPKRFGSSRKSRMRW